MTRMQAHIGDFWGSLLANIATGAGTMVLSDQLRKHGVIGDTDNPAALAKTPGALYQQIQWLVPYLVRAGFPQGKLITTYALAQIFYETAGLTSNGAQKYNNLSGIKYINKPYQKNAAAGPNGYAVFNSIQDWANDYYRILSLPPGRPIQATSAQGFIDALIANHYFGDNPNTYIAGFNGWLKKIAAALNQASTTWNSIQQGNQYVTRDEQGNYTTAPVQTDSNVLWQEAKAKAKASWDALGWFGKIAVGAAGIYVAVKMFED